MAKYTEWLTEMGRGKLEDWAADGLTNEEIAKNVGVNPDTLYRWMREHSEISEAITRGRGLAQVQIENALYLRARGGVQKLMKPMKRRVREYDAVTGKCVRDEEIVEEHEEEVYIAPDTPAIKFWLTNRARDRWSEKLLVEGEGKLSLEEMLRRDA